MKIVEDTGVNAGPIVQRHGGFSCRFQCQVHCTAAGPESEGPGSGLEPAFLPGRGDPADDLGDAPNRLVDLGLGRRGAEAEAHR